MKFFAFDFIPDRHKTQEMCDRVVSEDPTLIVCCPDKCITVVLKILSSLVSMRNFLNANNCRHKQNFENCKHDLNFIFYVVSENVIDFLSNLAFLAIENVVIFT